MSVDKRNLYTLRTIDCVDSFDSVGRITDKPGLVIYENLSGEESLKIIEEIDAANYLDVVDMTDAEGEEEVVGFRIKVKLATDYLVFAQSDRNSVLESIKIWAEKSRVIGQRGYRQSAVQNGRLERNKNNDKFTFTTKVILGTTAYYSDLVATCGIVYDDVRIEDELKSLLRGLKDTLGYQPEVTFTKL